MRYDDQKKSLDVFQESKKQAIYINEIWSTPIHIEEEAGENVWASILLLILRWDRMESELKIESYLVTNSNIKPILTLTLNSARTDDHTIHQVGIIRWRRRGREWQVSVPSTMLIRFDLKILHHLLRMISHHPPTQSRRFESSSKIRFLFGSSRIRIRDRLKPVWNYDRGKHAGLILRIYTSGFLGSNPEY